MAKSYDKQAHPKEFKESDLVLKKIFPILGEDKRKRPSNYEDPYMIKKAFSGRVLILSIMDGMISQTCKFRCCREVLCTNVSISSKAIKIKIQAKYLFACTLFLFLLSQLPIFCVYFQKL
jgi:hypothetical protein